MAARIAVFFAATWVSRARPLSAWPVNDWARVPIFAFPGCSPTFMDANHTSYFATSFQNLLIWGVNATCLAPNGSTFAPYCASSTCYCNQSYPETQSWVLNMETSLQAQGAALKTASQAALPVLGYIEGLSAQQYYVAQSELMHDPQYAPLLLRVQSRGLIDCYVDGCNWQGVEFRQYDLRQPAMRQYYTSRVLGTLISSPALDGTFIDVIDWWLDACGQWGCTAQETADLTNASLVATTEMLAYAQSIGKTLSISCHSTSDSHGAYYREHLAILQQFPDNAIRFYEFFVATYVADLIHEAQDLGLALHVHTGQRTLSPDWLELAAFLIAANNRSSFSYSQGAWMFDSFPQMPEFGRALGVPLGPPVNASTSQPHAAWDPLPGVNMIYDLPPAPNSSVPGVLAFLGLQPSAAACIELARANATYVGVTWVAPSQQNVRTAWALGCYARYDASFNPQQCLDTWNAGSPCWTAQEADCTSAVAAPIVLHTVVLSRDFEHLHVELNELTQSATLSWS